LTEIYETYGNPDVQISDNGPPFNSIQMQNFAKTKDIKLQKSPPQHPSSNPDKTFMRPLGKAMKTGRHSGILEKEIRLSLYLEKLQTDTSPSNQSSTGSYDFPP
jgi:hypothetical protein